MPEIYKAGNVDGRSRLKWANYKSYLLKQFFN